MSQDWLEDELSRENTEPLPSILGTVAEVAAKRQEVFYLLKEKEDHVKDLQRKLREIDEKELPDAMEAVGLTKVTLKTGQVVEVKPFVNAACPKEKESQFLDWLFENGEGDLIKDSFSLNFSKGQAEEAASLQELLEQKGFGFSRKSGVHAQTLKSWAKARVEAGAELPSMLHVYQGIKATIK